MTELTVRETQAALFARMAGGEKIRMTASYDLLVMTATGRRVDQRYFIGTDREAIDELEAEYNEHHPRRDDKLWQRAYATLHYTMDKVIVQSRGDALTEARVYTIERVGPFKEDTTGG